ncbi:lactonase family protein [Ferrimonas balearica]|uniref:lactonase family protein n=1 Tax=Ferrimonas balearica TaxID=44012 RepID=UPI001C996041|nr:lactonase family protein [Ferrimonas balearica]MBY5992855.1 lactonase family protein [Ferrimonas balearica]
MALTAASVLAAALSTGLTAPAPTEPQRFVIGTYTGASSEGIYEITLSPEQKTLAPAQLLTAMDNPSYLALSADQHHLYAVSETGKGAVHAFAWQAGALRPLGQQSSQGASPCHLSLHPDGQALAVANYMGGNSAVLPVEVDGALRPATARWAYQGQGPNTERQEAPHAHYAQWSADGRHLYTVDLGSDTLWQQEDGRSEPAVALKLHPGDGPRHLAFHPTLPVAYLLNELSNTLVVADRNVEDGTLSERQRLATLPEGFTGHSQAAAVKLSADGTRLYLSNRGHNSLAVFEVSSDGALVLMQHIDSGGDWPRDFALSQDGRWLVVANERSGRLALFAVAEDGSLSDTGRYWALDSPVAVLAIASEGE